MTDPTEIVRLTWRKETGSPSHYTCQHGGVRIHIWHRDSPTLGNWWAVRTQPASEPIWANTVPWFGAPTLTAAKLKCERWANTEGRVL